MNQQLPRVTYILDLLSKPDLIKWAANVGVDHMKAMVVDKVLNPIVSIVNETKDMSLIKAAEITDKFNSIKEIIGKNLLIDTDEFVKQAKVQHKAKKDEAADKGKGVHEAIERFLKADEDAEIEFDKNLEIPMEKFHKWWIDNEVEIVEIEFPVWSEAGGGYKGTLDVAGYVKKIFYIIDIKTSPRIYPEAFMQLAAYFYAFKERTNHIPERAAILRLDFTGKSEFHEILESELYGHYKRFLKLCEYWHLTNGK